MGEFGVAAAQHRGEEKPNCTKRSSISFAYYQIHLHN